MSIPKTTKAWIVARRGHPSKAVELRTIPVPKLALGQVLLKVDAAALNPIGWKVMQLAPNFIASRPIVAEYDLSGTIVDANGTHFKNGDSVFGFIAVPESLKIKSGALAQYTKVPADHLVIRPPNVSSIGAAGFTLAAQTAYQALFKSAKLESGQSVFINGGSSSVGAFAIQIAKAHGLKVTASASTQNEELVRSLGADEFVDYTARPLHQTLKSLDLPTKYHAIIDAAALATPPLYRESHNYLTPDGVYVSMGPWPKLTFKGIKDITSLISYAVLPTWLGGATRKFTAVGLQHDPKDLEALATLAAEGKLKPVVDSVFEFDDVHKAYERIMTGRAKGKVIVKVNPDAS